MRTPADPCGPLQWLATVPSALPVTRVLRARGGCVRAALSWADLIVFAGTVALEVAGAPPMTFCPGRTVREPTDPTAH